MKFGTKNIDSQIYNFDTIISRERLSSENFVAKINKIVIGGGKNSHSMKSLSYRTYVLVTPVFI